MRELTLFDVDGLAGNISEPEAPRPATDAPTSGEPCFTPSQRAAIDERAHSLALSASAGSGKTSVLVERFVRAVLDDGIDCARILAITFTDKAAGELRERLRARFIALGRRDEAAAAQTAFVSTIHGFCARLLRAHPLAAGLDPGFVVLDEPRAARLRDEASASALRRFLADGGDPALDLVAAYGPDPLGLMVRGAYDELRSRGAGEPRLPVVTDQPQPEAQRQALATACGHFASELAAAGTGARVEAAREALDHCARLLEMVQAGAVTEPGALSALTITGGNTAALNTDAGRAYATARDDYAQACADHHAAAHVGLIDTLLGHYGEAYARRKAALGAVDFDDLELNARNLLRDQPAVRAAWRERFSLLMVDEFQDTNQRQLELVSALEDDNLFTVGDAQQSIYAFRHADVRLFEARRDALARRGLALELAENFRCAPAIVSALNTAFGGSDHVELVAGRPASDFALGGDEPAVELLLTGADGWDAPDAPDLGVTLPPSQLWRHAEARVLARRLRELADAGEPTSEMAVLVRASASMGVIERALADEGLAAVATAGRGFWSRQEVVDLVAYLTVLANPLDERALVSLLGSPLCGASSDALAILSIAARARSRDLWWHLRAALVEGEDDAGLEALGETDRARLGALAARVVNERARPGRDAIDAQLERAMRASGYDVHCIGLYGGERRLANVDKLLRLARDFEATEGRDLRGLVDHVAALESAQRREPEAPVDDPDGAAIRLMTIHAAKGLEFATVAVADLGRTPNIRAGALLHDDRRVGLRLSLLDGAKATPALDHAALKAEYEAALLAEERRVFYVAATRAQRRLILSGAVERWSDSATATPMNWLGRALVPDLEQRLQSVRAGGSELARSVSFHAGATVAVTISTSETRAVQTPPAALAADAASSGDLLTPSALKSPLDGAVTSVAPSPFTGALSYTSLKAWSSCGYRFYARRVLGMAERPVPPALAESTGAGNGLDARVRGVVFHALAEELDIATPKPADASRIAALAEAEGATTGAVDLADVAALLQTFATHPLRARLAAAPRLYREYEFALELRAGDPSAALLTGVVDALAVESDGTWLIADWKTDRLTDPASEDTEALVVRDYAVQRALYALAALRAGAPRVEVVHLFLDAPDRLASAVYTIDDEPALIGQVAALADPLRAGRYPLTDRPHAALCATCPARGGLCPYPPRLTLRASPEAV